MTEPVWACPQCGRAFTRKNQRHACGTGSTSDVLRGRPAEVVALYTAVEAFATSLGPVEIVARDRYVLLRSRRVFADMSIMTDAIRLAIHLGRRVQDERFFKIAADRNSVTHVAKLRLPEDLEEMKPFLREAYEFSVGDVRSERVLASEQDAGA